MAHIAIGKRDGKWFFTAQGCCDSTSARAMYERAHAVQVLEEGGHLNAWDAAGFELEDRRGRLHRYPRSWRPYPSSSSSGT
ncbi:MAG TPA: hypothetical protein VNS99_03170 [Gaiellales bacterium]|jgi:hypothetical protein|nr:hypothetical protein [Gaiellales bacterium]